MLFRSAVRILTIRFWGDTPNRIISRASGCRYWTDRIVTDRIVTDRIVTDCIVTDRIVTDSVVTDRMMLVSQSYRAKVQQTL